MSDEGRLEVTSVDVTQVAGPRGIRAPVLFVLAFMLSAATLGSPVLLLSRSSAVGSGEELPTARPVTTVAAAAPRAAAPAEAPVKVTGAAGSAQPGAGGVYRVIFNWVLEGARQGDPIVVRFLVGGRVVAEESGALDPPGFVASTGRITIATSQPCSAEGWSAELVSVRDHPPVGDAVSRAAGAACR